MLKRFRIFAGDGGTAAVIENNFARQVRMGVFHDFWSSKDLIVRNNYFTDVFAGVQQNMSGSNVPKLGQTLTHNVKIATFTTVNNHGLVSGDAVIIAIEPVRVARILAQHGLCICLTGES